MLKPVLTSAPAALPVTTDEAKAQLSIAHSDQDAFISRLVAAATAHLDGYAGVLGRALITQTWRQDFHSFADCLRLPLEPVQSVSSVTYYDSDNVLQTLATSFYNLHTDAIGPRIVLKPDQFWPSTYKRDDAVSVTFMAGYGADETAVPEGIRHAILMLVAHWYRNRETVVVGVVSGEMAKGLDTLAGQYRRPCL